MIEKKCLYCNKIIEDNSYTKTKLYCSESCSNAYRQLQKEQECQECHKKFHSRSKRKYCDKCKNKSHKLNEKYCLFCKNIFIDSTKSQEKIYCSESCSNAYRQLQKEQECQECRVRFKHHVKRKYCDKCKWKVRIKYKKKKCLWCGKDLINKNYCNKDCHYNYNKDKYIKKAKEWKKRNPIKNLKINNKWKKKKYKEDYLYKINSNLRNHLRTILINYTNTGKIKSTKDYGISLKKIIKKFEKDAGFCFSKNPEKAINFIKGKEIEHNIPIHKIFGNKKYESNDKELLNKIKFAYSQKNLSLVEKKKHIIKSAIEMSEHQRLKKYIEDKEKIIIREISSEDAKLIVDLNHYSDVMPRATKFYLGGFLGNILIGIMTLGWGVQPKRTIKKIFPPLSQKDYLEIGKLCLDERMPRNSESRFISSCFKYIKELNLNLKLIYSWSDGLLGKPGFVYQASNFLYGGSVWSKRYFTKEGFKIHPRSSYYLCEDNAKKEGINKLTWLTKKYMKSKGIKLYKGLQFRYCYFLCDEKEKDKIIASSKFNWNLAYPKFEDLKWMVKKDGKYIECQQPEYTHSLTAAETIKYVL